MSLLSAKIAEIGLVVAERDGLGLQSALLYVLIMLPGPVLPLALKKYQEVHCHICRFSQDIKNRPDVQSQINAPQGQAPPQQYMSPPGPGYGGQPPPPGQGPPGGGYGYK
ncbi:hypothetical protein AJ80_06535 [Polytolypa hystricis UAMH7299]|uniref:Uncharacterized protein n=1 Tax=Polytolypa hystricis (strain UAMH7299) TaxID=1447883 RepID=A0A2B7XVA4_POLH7|nr:hypothetical protein AJ80_06535 [Polytolypa hystricis UAMH7299]